LETFDVLSRVDLKARLENVMMRIAVFSKERLFLDAIAGLLDRKGNISVVAREASAKALVASAKINNAQVLIVDSSGLDADEVQFLLGARAIGDFAIGLITGGNVTLSDSAVDAVVSRDSSGDELIDKLNSLEIKAPARAYVREGKRAYGRGNMLTRREYEVAEYVAKGFSNRKISDVSGLREQSVKNLVSVIMRKLQCENRTQVALKLINAEVEVPND
jgi:two-component system nitrate/nitrite response regulator NarP